MKTIAIVGQPNCGKSTIFNFLTGMSQTVGNWPGVTVDRKTGKFPLADASNAEVIDLPGVYSLSPISNDEKVTRDYLLDDSPDLIINVIEGPTMERGLFLTLQLLMIGIPTIVVINMQDVMSKQKIDVDVEKLKYLLGCKVIGVSGRTGMNLDYLKSEIRQFFSEYFVLREKHIPMPPNDPYYSLLNSLSAILATTGKFGKMCSFYALKLLEGNNDIENRARRELGDEFANVQAVYSGKVKPESLELINWLYGIARGIYEDTVKEPQYQKVSNTDIMDFFLLNRIFAIPVFLLTMFILFFCTYSLGNILSGLFGSGISFIAGLVPGSGFMSLLLTDGVIGGVGNVLILLPYIFIMFLLIQFLEDSGYMARIAFIMDRFMHSIGLHGRSFIPLVMGFGCSVPAVMAARTLDTPQNRLKTILMIPFIPCSARLPVIVLISSAIFGSRAPFMIFSLYIISIITAILSGVLFSKTALRDKSEGMIMELPDYRWPQAKNLFVRAWSQSKEYLLKAGTVIFGISVVLFILSYFPRGTEGGFIHIAGHYISPLFRPLGFDIPMTVSLITGFFAKESIISTLSVLYQTSALPLSDYLSAHWNALSGFVFMVFVMIYIPCIATVAVIRKETGSNKWTLISVLYSLAAAYTISLLFKLILGLLNV